MKNKLSIIIPVYNEAETIARVISNLDKVKYPCDYEIIIVNDGSNDQTKERIIKSDLIKRKHIKFISYDINQGKGFAIRTGLKKAKGNLFIIQDADFEYDPRQIPKLIMPLLNKESEVVYGSRFLKSKNTRLKFHANYYANKFLTFLTNLLYGCSLTDMETCYKAFNKKVKNCLNLTLNGFGFEVEFTSQICKKDFKIIEMPIDYNPRSWKEGKKINWKDGIKAIWYLLKLKK